MTTATMGKPPEVQGWSNRRLFHPAARRLATLLARTPVTPNMVSVTGAAMVVAAGALYAFVGGLAGIGAGLALHLAWHVVDGADGDLARMTGRASPWGEIVDGMSDYGGHALLYLLLAVALSAMLGPWAYALAFAAGLSRVAQSIYAESQRRTYMWWAYDVPWLRAGATAAPAAGGLTGAYLSASRLLSAGTERVDRLLAAARADPRERGRIAELARSAGRGTLPLQILLGANPRSVLLGLSMAAGGPIWFFLIELTVMNLLLLASIAQQTRSSRRIAALVARGR